MASIAAGRFAAVAFGLCLAFSIYVHFLGAMITPSGFNNDIDFQPRRLWAVRNSELRTIDTQIDSDVLAPGS